MLFSFLTSCYRKLLTPHPALRGSPEEGPNVFWVSFKYTFYYRRTFNVCLLQHSLHFESKIRFRFFSSHRWKQSGLLYVHSGFRIELSERMKKTFLVVVYIRVLYLTLWFSLFLARWFIFDRVIVTSLLWKKLKRRRYSKKIFCNKRPKPIFCNAFFDPSSKECVFCYSVKLVFAIIFGDPVFPKVKS